MSQVNPSELSKEELESQGFRIRERIDIVSASAKAQVEKLVGDLNSVRAELAKRPKDELKGEETLSGE